MTTDGGTGSARAKLSAFVIAYNRAPIVGTCLRALAFADEIVVIDKGSTDGTLAIAKALADRVIGVPWSPAVEETRGFAASQCTHDWILFLDDDECLSSEAVRFIDAELSAPRADIYLLPQRHYILGRHDERAYYWPEHQMRLFRRGSVTFTDTLHNGSRLLSDRIHAIPPDDGACIHHLSHRDVTQFIEKTNRYTSQPARDHSSPLDGTIAQFAHQRIEELANRADVADPDGYLAAVGMLRALYDIIDRLKAWETGSGLDGTMAFAEVCERLDAGYAAELSGLRRPHAAQSGHARAGLSERLTAAISAAITAMKRR